MYPTKAYAAPAAKKPLEPFKFNRRDLGPKDVLIEIAYCGICHSDVHQARDEWGGGIFPMVPGHEIAGVVKEIGSDVKKFKVGDTVGVGCMVDSCRTCPDCKEDLEQYCTNHVAYTYNGTEMDEKTPTYGGYSSQTVVTEDFVLRVDPKLPLDRVAPLLCAGITTYSPLKHWKVGPGKKVAVAGLGGLGHMAVQIAAALGAEVTVLSTSPAKKADAMRLGATHFINTKEPIKEKRYFDFIISTVSSAYALNQYTELLKRDGTMVVVGVPEKPIELEITSLIFCRRAVAGSLIGGIAETQEMLDFCAKHNILADIELISIDNVNTAYDRMVKNDVHFRFVIDMKSL
jgi:uncharacterized zinc-type alcohol dehydrogenase-like protein